MKYVSTAFKKLESGEIVPIGYQWVNCHMIFDVKVEYFRRKSRLVAGVHMTDSPSTITYVIIVLRETVRIALTLSALNELPVKVADIHNAYTRLPVTEKIWTFLGQDFGEDAGRKSIVVWALYGLKISGAASKNHLTDRMHHLGFFTFPSDLDIWMKPMVRHEDRFDYYAYILIYM